MNNMLNRVLAGGYLLENIIEKYLEVFKDRGDKEDLSNAKKRAKRNLLSAIVGCSGSEKCWRNHLRDSLLLSGELMEELYRGLVNGFHSFDSIISLSLVLRSLGLVGSGGGLLRNIFEVGLNIDWVLGLPYYPGSSIKGAVRATAEEFLKEETVKRIFGREGEEGSISSLVFYDSYPIGCEGNGSHPCLILTGGVVTPHYYSNGETVKAESDATPTPIQHIVIAPGTVFRVIVGIRCPTYRAENGNTKIDTGAMKEVISRILVEDHARVCDTSLNDKNTRCPCIQEYTTALAVLITTTLSKGFAARSAKGYNILDLYTGEITRDVKSLALYIPSPARQDSRPKESHSTKPYRDHRMHKDRKRRHPAGPGKNYSSRGRKRR